MPRCTQPPDHENPRPEPLGVPGLPKNCRPGTKTAKIVPGLTKTCRPGTPTLGPGTYTWGLGHLSGEPGTHKWEQGTPTTFPARFDGQGLISWWRPCPLEVPEWPKRGQGVGPEIRPCPSECVLFTLSFFHSLSNRISLIDLRRKRPKTLQVVGAKDIGNREGCGWWATLPAKRP